MALFLSDIISYSLLSSAYSNLSYSLALRPANSSCHLSFAICCLTLIFSYHSFLDFSIYDLNSSAFFWEILVKQSFQIAYLSLLVFLHNFMWRVFPPTLEFLMCSVQNFSSRHFIRCLRSTPLINDNPTICIIATDLLVLAVFYLISLINRASSISVTH